MSAHTDERTVVIENASYRWGYLVMSYGLLLLVAYRSLLGGESSWDLLGLVIVGGLVPSAYQGANHVLTRRWTITQLAAIGAGLVIAALVALFRR